MAIDNKTGGPAFPTTVRKAENYMDEGGYGRSRLVSVQEGGMTLRDYFAAKVMAGMVKSLLMHDDPDEFVNPESYENLAHKAYYIADAMLEEREK